MKLASPREITLDLMRFMERSPTAAHAVVEATTRLEAAGFKHIQEGDSWALAAGDRFYVVRGHHALVAGIVGTGALAEHGFRLAGAHVDAPGLRLKPSPYYAGNGYLQFGVEVYGGPILATWVDRDLTLAGKLLLRVAGQAPRVVLVQGDRALCRIPMHAIHFNRELNDQGLKLDKQKHLPPIFGLGDDDTLKAEPVLKHFAERAQVVREDVLGFELEVVDLQPPALGGVEEDLLFAPRIDNIAGSHASLQALIDSGDAGPSTRVVALFDAEEIGSQTLGGAGSCFLDDVLERLCLTDAQPREALHRALSRSILASVDGAHAVHPNFADFHDPRHRPVLNGGPVIKINAIQRYATTAQSRHWFERCAERAEVPVQHYVHRTDLPCGSTIGPMTATRLGISTVDVGSPMLAMHSIRETGGMLDQRSMIAALLQHFTV